MTAVSRRTTPRKPVTPIRCASWCEDGDGHADARFAEDQWCTSADIEITTRLHEEWEMVDGAVEPARMKVYTRRDPEAPAYAVVCTPEDAEIRLTPDEARQMAAALRHFAWVSEQDASLHNAFTIGADAQRLGVLD